MKRIKPQKKRNRCAADLLRLLLTATLTITLLAGCGSSGNGRIDQESGESGMEQETPSGDASDQETSDASTASQTGIANESGKDAEIDFTALQAENPDIFAWLYIPDTDIDYPVLQSEEADNYYESHNAFGEVSDEGAVYTELANLKDMCDFNTVLHGKTTEDGKEGLFSELYQFADPDFFEAHEYAYLYLEGNVLTYEIFAAYERENTSLIRTYDFTYQSGCQQFLDDLYDTRTMGMNIRDGWREERVTPYHFLITLTTQKGENPDTQYVVVAALVNDAAGTIDRVVSD